MNQQLAEFLITASADNTLALAEAQAHEVQTHKLIHRDTMNGLLAKFKLYMTFKAIAADNSNPFQNEFAAFLASEEYNFKFNSNTGLAQIGMLDLIIAAKDQNPALTALSDAVSALKPVILSIANPVSSPFENVTLADIEYHRQEIVELGALDVDGITFNIANTAKDRTNIVIEHKFGADANDLTPWRPIANRVVLDNQETYYIRIGDSPTAYRELRIVSPVTLGLSVA